MSSVPELVGRYRIVRPLGRGRLGDLYLAIDPALDLEVAVRVLPLLSQEEWQRLLQTMKSIARLQHPALAPIFNVWEQEGRSFYARQYIPGHKPSYLTPAESPVPLRCRLEWVVTVCQALAYAHRQNVVGLVVEPSDLIIDEAGAAHIVDLGLGPLVAGAQRDPSYPAPETIAGQAPDRRSDIFAAGALLYELTTGEKPFGRGSTAEITERIVAGAHWIRHEDLEGALAAIVTRALQFDAAGRYQDFDELRSDLRRVLAQDDDHEASGAEPPPAPAAPAQPDRVEVEPRVKELLVVANAALGARVFEAALASAEHALLIEPASKLALEIAAEARAALEARREQDVRRRSELELGSDDRRPVDLTTARRVDDNVRFTVYRPAAMAPSHWYPWLLFTHLAERRPDAPADEPDPIAQVEATARSLLGPAASSFPRIVQDAGAGIPHEALLRIVPAVPGLTFNPPEYSFLWTDSVHKAEFKVRASASLEGQTARGSIDVRMGAISVALITVAIPIDARTGDVKTPVPEVFQPYRRIFASYSHKDTAIVQQFENYARGMGDSYMRDVIHLRAGELWDDRLLGMIDEADVFQLFWSSNSIRSPFVRREWEHALTIAKSNFVRPLYWESPLPERDGLPPPELKARHFASVAVTGAAGPDEIGRRVEEERHHEERRLGEAQARQRAEEEARHARMEVERRQQMEEQRARVDEQRREHERAKAHAEAEARRREDKERQASDEGMISKSEPAVLSRPSPPVLVRPPQPVLRPPYSSPLDEPEPQRAERTMSRPSAPKMSSPERSAEPPRRLSAVSFIVVIALVGLVLAFLAARC
jgi:hypothetical protein